MIETRTLARAATWLENRDPRGAAFLREHLAQAGKALVIGITGPPGAGKSTLCDQLIGTLRAEGKRVAVITVDPSSPLSGGAILGDRIRMLRHHADPDVWIRSMATRGQLGGLARTTGDLVLLADAAGFDVVLVETVGVGQDEVEIARLADVTLVVLTPGAGDDVQSIKAGIMEIAHVFVINKADLQGADRLEQDIHASYPEAAIVKTIALEGKGVSDVLARGRDAAQPRHQARLKNNRGGKIDHLGIAVRSIDDALAFYRDMLGMEVAMRETVAVERVNAAMLPVGESRFELLEASDPDSVIAKFIDKRGPGIHHIAITVPDLPAAVARLKANGARLLNEPRAGAGGHIYVFVHPSSTGGVLLELIQE